MPRHRKNLDADEQIEAMTRKLASLDRRLANLECLRPADLGLGAGAPSPARPSPDGAPRAG
jgi:hypothetical protein